MTKIIIGVFDQVGVNMGLLATEIRKRVFNEIMNIET